MARIKAKQVQSGGNGEQGSRRSRLLRQRRRKRQRQRQRQGKVRQPAYDKKADQEIFANVAYKKVIAARRSHNGLKEVYTCIRP